MPSAEWLLRLALSAPFGAFAYGGALEEVRQQGPGLRKS